MQNEFSKVMSAKTNEELIKIVTVERESYTPQAVEAADYEIKKRNVNTSEFERVTERITAEKEQKQIVDSSVVSSGVRFINFLIDSIICLILILVESVIIGILNQEGLIFFGYILIFGTFIGYYAFMEIKFQKTVGKFITKTKVVKMSGEKPQNGDIITRTFCRLIPFDRISFLFVKNGIHDILSKTKVVKDSERTENT